MAKEAKARIKINKLLESAGWRFFDNEEGKANILLESNTTIQRVNEENPQIINKSLPSLILQQIISEKIQKEQQIVNSNKELIIIFEQKIKDGIALVWGELWDVKGKGELNDRFLYCNFWCNYFYNFSIYFRI